MDVSIIIINYNTRELTMQCLKSVFKQTKELDFEIIIVDNASSDGSCIAIKELFPQTIIIESDENLGFGKANNLGSEVAQGKYLFFLNSDTVLLNNAVYIFFEFMTNKPTAAICGGSLYSKENTPTHSYGFLPTIKNDMFFSLRLDKIFGQIGERYKEKLVKEVSEVEYITGADMFISKNIFEKVGLFDKDFFMYYEEAELTYRIHKYNYKCFLIPSAKILHFGQVNNMSPQKLKIYFTSKFLYFKKTTGLASSIFIKYWWITTLLIKAIILVRKKEIAYINILLSKE